ncbi:AP-4 complex accessory subunit RUSC1 isoform X2 [Ascaphus truei]|uniref:AP-4 complex accessory subunit RUSC1 isoform X2 n=1 Tax=Ascaphus truei TaxID=8439 RepID=UPI003F5A4C38
MLAPGKGLLSNLNNVHLQHVSLSVHLSLRPELMEVPVTRDPGMEEVTGCDHCWKDGSNTAQVDINSNDPSMPCRCCDSGQVSDTCYYSFQDSSEQITNYEELMPPCDLPPSPLSPSSPSSDSNSSSDFTLDDSPVSMYYREFSHSGSESPDQQPDIIPLDAANDDPMSLKLQKSMWLSPGVASPPLSHDYIFPLTPKPNTPDKPEHLNSNTDPRAAPSPDSGLGASLDANCNALPESQRSALTPPTFECLNFNMGTGSLSGSVHVVQKLTDTAKAWDSTNAEVTPRLGEPPHTHWSLEMEEELVPGLSRPGKVSTQSPKKNITSFHELAQRRRRSGGQPPLAGKDRSDWLIMFSPDSEHPPDNELTASAFCQGPPGPQTQLLPKGKEVTTFRELRYRNVLIKQISQSGKGQTPIERGPQHTATGKRGTQHPATGERKPQHTATGEREPQHPAMGEREPQHPAMGEREPEHPTMGEREPQHTATGERRLQHPAMGEREPQHPAMGEREPQHPTMGEREPQHIAMGEREPPHPTMGEREPQHPAMGEREPQHPTMGEREPKHPAMGEREPQHPAMGEREPQHPAIGERRPQHPAMGERRPQHPAMGEREPQHPAMGEREPQHPAMGERRPQHPAMGERELQHPAMGEWGPQYPATEERGHVPDRRQRVGQLQTIFQGALSAGQEQPEKRFVPATSTAGIRGMGDGGDKRAFPPTCCPRAHTFPPFFLHLSADQSVPLLPPHSLDNPRYCAPALLPWPPSSPRLSPVGAFSPPHRGLLPLLDTHDLSVLLSPLFPRRRTLPRLTPEWGPPRTPILDTPYKAGVSNFLMGERGEDPGQRERKGLLVAISSSVDKIISHFNTTRNLVQKARLGDSWQSPELGYLILNTLSPSLHALLAHGLRPYQKDVIVGRRRLSPWSLVEASMKPGAARRSLHSVLCSVRRLPQLRDPRRKFNAFVFGLLNTKQLDMWISQLHQTYDILSVLYEPAGFLPLAGTSRPDLFEELLLTLQPLSVLTFHLDLLFEHQHLPLQDPLAPSDGSDTHGASSLLHVLHWGSRLTHSLVWGAEQDTHRDTPSTHGDTPSTHGDTPSTHGDTPSTHGDTPSTHGDALSTHGDTPSTHRDTSSTHGDTPSNHGDTPSTHGDTPSTHRDTSSTHGDTPQETSSTHGDTPQETSSTQVDTPQETSSTHKDTPQEMSSTHMDTPQETSSTHRDTPQETSSTHRDTPQETSSTHRDTPQETSSTHRDTPQETSSTHRDTPQETSSTHSDTPQETSSTHRDTPQETSSTHRDTPEDTGPRRNWWGKLSQASRVYIPPNTDSFPFTHWSILRIWGTPEIERGSREQVAAGTKRGTAGRENDPQNTGGLEGGSDRPGHRRPQDKLSEGPAASASAQDGVDYSEVSARMVGGSAGAEGSAESDITQRGERHHSAEGRGIWLGHLFGANLTPVREMETRAVRSRRPSSWLPPSMNVLDLVRKTPHPQIMKTLPQKSEAAGQQNTRKPERSLRALCDHAGSDQSHLSFKKGDILQMLCTVDEDWIQCRNGNDSGLVPLGYTSLIM